MPLRYLFLDMNSYFASVEQQLRPELRERPVAVVPVMAETTCCIAASYEAKRFGIKTGTMVREARRLCPDLRVVEARHELYIKTHHRLIEVVDSCQPVQAVLSIDELACRLWHGEQEPEQATHIAERIKEAIRHELGSYIRCSIGLAPNRLLAKVASDMQKPDGLTVIRSEELPDRLYSLQLRDFPGIGSRMEQRLRRAKINTVPELIGLSVTDLAAIWGSRLIGETWWRLLRGEDVPAPPTHRRSIGHSHVLPPKSRCDSEAQVVLLRLVDKAAARLRSYGYWAGSISISVRFLHGSSWQTRHGLTPCQDTLTLVRATNDLWEGKPPGAPLHVGVVLSDLVHDRNMAPPLFEADHKLRTLSQAMDEVQRKFGVDSVRFAGMRGSRAQIPNRIAFTHVPEIEEDGRHD
ncbi:MAG: DNA polymerase [Planctomycetales bacterium]|nr:DNA polymerase [Planctomycetales bacterium]